MKSEIRSSNSSASLGNRSRPRNLSFRRKTPETRTINENLDRIEEIQATRSDPARLKVLLENLDIRFEDCTFSYKQSHFEEMQRSASSERKRSKISAIRGKIFSAFEKVREAITCEKTFNKCLFVPIDEKDQVKDFIRENFPEITLSFEECKFIKRSSTLSEKIVRKLRNYFGIQFELEYINSTATVKDCTFKIKDILFVNQHLQERIVNEA